MSTTVTSPMIGTVVAVPVAVDDAVAEGTTLVVLESMKMEHPVRAQAPGTVEQVRVAAGQTVEAGDPLVTLGAAAPATAADTTDPAATRDLDHVRDDLQAVRDRQSLLADDARPDAVARRHATGHRTARENIADLVDPGSFAEYGGFAVAAQRSRRSMDELRAQTPADGMVTGTATVNADLVGADRAQVAVAAYDYTVLAGTQGFFNHAKKDRLFELAHRHRLPVVLYAEGGGGRPGDTDVQVAASMLQSQAFALFARLSGHVPTVAVVSGRCFAGNAALAGCADVVIATEDATLGMAGPAMIEGGGLGRVRPEEIGPMAVQRANGVVDVVVTDEAEATAVAQQYLSYFQGRVDHGEHADQRRLRTVVPQHRREVYDVRAGIEVLFDTGSVLELRRDFAPGMVTALARLDGQPVGVLANDPTHLGGAIDADGADVAARLLQLCDAHGLPVVVLCDTPGFMVGPDAERDASVRHFSRMFVAGANLQVPIVAVVTRKAYGLGAQAMLGGHLRVPVVTLGWPTSELGPMGLEGAVRLGFRRELEAIEDPEERAEREEQMIALAHANAEGLNVASFFEIDDVIDPADTRERLLAALAAADPPAGPAGRAFVDTW